MKRRIKSCKMRQRVCENVGELVGISSTFNEAFKKTSILLAYLTLFGGK